MSPCMYHCRAGVMASIAREQPRPPRKKRVTVVIIVAGLEDGNESDDRTVLD